MDVESGRLMRAELLKALGENGELSEEEQKNFEPVPVNLERAAMLKLAGADEAQVSLTSGGKLSKWAAKERKKRKSRNKIARQSRKRNR